MPIWDVVDYEIRSADWSEKFCALQSTKRHKDKRTKIHRSKIAKKPVQFIHFPLADWSEKSNALQSTKRQKGTKTQRKKDRKTK